MSQTMTIRFESEKRVVADYDDFQIATDQPLKSGGRASAPQPYDLFLASLATCAGYYVQHFCESRKIPLNGIGLEQSWERNEKKKIVAIRIRILVPPDFPDKYHAALVRAVDQCAVKKTLFDPPEITTDTVVHG